MKPYNPAHLSKLPTKSDKDVQLVIDQNATESKEGGMTGDYIVTCEGLYQLTAIRKEGKVFARLVQGVIDC